jgi:predicted nucleic acid-binding protein
MNNQSILVDSNVLVYAINSSSPKQKQAQTFLQDNIGYLVLAQQNIFEVLRVLTHGKFPLPMSPDDAIKAVSAIAEVAYIINPELNTYHIALSLIQKYKITDNKIFDAYLSATAISSGINTIATDNDKDFEQIKEIRVINPFI